ncbi:hypothetical protein [Planomicrobium sp. YIM 101495]|uniref:hypothetical protein n=1 Tax=Planomicrobium sp. YIM 101495 TaxID=2665160 RepID=UPI0012BA2A45|nr:hypothetical protein [Planomicrobium sp. YIM 101495]MTD31518.1 hypothetical protein [Planomicrobium sp. YIM 101495]
MADNEGLCGDLAVVFELSGESGSIRVGFGWILDVFVVVLITEDVEGVGFKRFDAFSGCFGGNFFY